MGQGRVISCSVTSHGAFSVQDDFTYEAINAYSEKL